MEKREFIYEGKAKQLYKTDDENLVIVHYKDDKLQQGMELKKEL